MFRGMTRLQRTGANWLGEDIEKPSREETLAPSTICTGLNRSGYTA